MSLLTVSIKKNMQYALEQIPESKYVELCLGFRFYDRNFPILKSPCNVKKLTKISSPTYRYLTG